MTRIHRDKECCVKLEAMRSVVLLIKNNNKDSDINHLCDSILELVRELKGELDVVE
jgi:hypothetical protein